MEWNRAGRPRSSSGPAAKPVWLERDWTDEELSVIAATERDAVAVLAVCVVRQWIRDGRPERDREGIRPWVSVIREHLNYKEGKEGGYRYGGDGDREEVDGGGL